MTKGISNTNESCMTKKTVAANENKLTEQLTKRKTIMSNGVLRAEEIKWGMMSNAE